MSAAPSADSLMALADYLSGRMTLYCAKCRLPDPNIPTDIPRIDLWCTYCSTILGRILATPPGASAISDPANDRWHRLELDDSDAT